MTILVTGFDPFDNALHANPSASVALALTDPSITNLILPTSYQRATELLDKRLEQGDITALIMLGYAKNIPGLRLEKYARNRTTAVKRPDNDGVILHGPIDPQGHAILPTLLATEKLLELIAKDCPVTISENAGGYVCNYTYYHALSKWTALPSIFIHLSAGETGEMFPQIVAGVQHLAQQLGDSRSLNDLRIAPLPQ